MNPPTIEVIVDPQGETTVRTTGYSGRSCLDASRWLEEALGIVVAERKTEEFFATAEEQQQIRQ